MNVLELQAVLDTLDQDHQLVVEKVQVLKDTVSFLLDPEDQPPHRVLERLREINEFFTSHLETHFLEEETTLFPFLAQHKPEGAEWVARLQGEHADIRRKIDEFSGCLEVALQVDEGPYKMVLRDLLAYGWELWELLDRHAHEETRAVNQCITRFLKKNGR